MEYQVTYDIQQVAYPSWWIFGVGLVFVSAGTAALLLRDNTTYKSVFDNTGIQRTLMPVFAIGFGLLWVGLGTLNYSHFANLRNTARIGGAEVVEGEVKEFVPMPYEGHAQETFVVSGRTFSYSDYDETKGFNHTQSHGGPMREGLQVRIAHVDGSIVKLEIAR
jgi:hypothetical protein